MVLCLGIVCSCSMLYSFLWLRSGTLSWEGLPCRHETFCRLWCLLLYILWPPFVYTFCLFAQDSGTCIHHFIQYYYLHCLKCSANCFIFAFMAGTFYSITICASTYVTVAQLPRNFPMSWWGCAEQPRLPGFQSLRDFFWWLGSWGTHGVLIESCCGQFLLGILCLFTCRRFYLLISPAAWFVCNVVSVRLTGWFLLRSPMSGGLV